MNAKIFIFFLLTAFLLAASSVLALSFSASTGTLTSSVNSTLLTLTNTGTEAITAANAVLSAATLTDGTHTATISQSGSFALPLASAASTTQTFTISGFSAMYLGSYSVNINVSASNATDGSSQVVPLTFVKSYCSAGTLSNGTTKYIEIVSVKDTSSDNDWEWKPSDEVTISVKVKYHNTLDSDDDIDAIIKLEIYDTQTHTFVDLDNEDDLERDVGLEEGSSQTEEFLISVPIEDMDDSSDRYKLYAKVYEDGKESTLCADTWSSSQYSQNIRIEKNSYDVILKDIEVSSSSVPCGQEVTITGTAINVGSNDEDKVYIAATNVQLKVNLSTSVFALDEGDSNKFSFTFMVPKDAVEKTYVVYMESHFKYSDSSERYREESDAYEAEVKVENCIPPVLASVTAELNSETPKAVIGKQVIVDATIKNTGTTSASYIIVVSGNTAWSSVSEIDPKTFTLEADAEKKVSIYLDINADAEESDKTFTIKTTSGTYSITKDVQLALVKGFTTDAIINHLKEKWYIYAIALVNLILIIAIIMAIVSLSRRKS